MTKQKFPAVPDEIRLEELLGKIQPVPSEGFHQKMKQVVWRNDYPMRNVSNRRVKLALAMTVLALLAGLLISPQGRAWAQEVFQFFKKVSFTTIPVSQEESQWLPMETYELPLVPVIPPTPAPEMAALTECQPPQNVQSYACQVAYAETQLSMDLKEFPKTPNGWIFKSVNFDVTSKLASFIYTHYSEHGGNFVLRQGEGKFQSDYWDMVPEDKVEIVDIGPFSGEYVLGRFTLSQGDNAWRWDTEFEDQRLAWADGKRWYYMEIEPPSPKHISRDQLVELAAGLVNSPLERADPLNPDSLSSIAEAEEYSGLDLKAPTLLPLGYGFSYARYFSFNNAVHLHYEYDADLVIYEWNGKPDNFEALANIYKDHEIVNVNGSRAFYGVPKSVSQYESSYLFLAWQHDNLNYRMYFYFDPTWGGSRLDKTKMITVAESMDDINDYRSNDYRSYEHVAIYEKALGFDAKEFSTTPDEWSFTNVYASPDCISISYSMTKETGELSLSQCKTDEPLISSTIPENAIEQVNLNGKNGQYIAGKFEIDSNGSSVWNLDAPMRQLRWQEDNLWIQIVLTGDSIVLYDKEDLISYAESLR